MANTAARPTEAPGHPGIQDPAEHRDPGQVIGPPSWGQLPPAGTAPRGVRLGAAHLCLRLWVWFLTDGQEPLCPSHQELVISSLAPSWRVLLGRLSCQLLDMALKERLRTWKRVFCWLILLAFGLLGLLQYGLPLVRHLEALIPMGVCPSARMALLRDNFTGLLNPWARPDVLTCTSWGAPIIWDGTFDPAVAQQEALQQNLTIGLTVFAVGRYLEKYLARFLETAERHFMVGQRVVYYVFTERPAAVPRVALARGRRLRVERVARERRWQDVSMQRMRTLHEALGGRLGREAHFVLCMDVDQHFRGAFGPEVLAESVAQLHAWHYHWPRRLLPYERDARSAAALAPGEGDFYYHAAVFGGSVAALRGLTAQCARGQRQDRERGLEARWHDESHLNKFFWLHKPAKVLSPEFCWSPEIGRRAEIRRPRLLWAPKEYALLRD